MLVPPSVFMWRPSAEDHDESRRKNESLQSCRRGWGDRNGWVCISCFTSEYLKMSRRLTVTKKCNPTKLVKRLSFGPADSSREPPWRLKSGLMNNRLRVPEQISSLQVFRPSMKPQSRPGTEPANWGGGTLISPETKNIMLKTLYINVDIINSTPGRYATFCMLI